MRSRSACVLLLLFLPAFLPAQAFDFDASRSADQLRLGVNAFHRGLYNEATLALEKALSYQPTNVLALTWLGRAQQHAGYEQEALRTWQQVVDAGTGSSLVKDWISVLAYRRGLGRDLAGSTAWAVSAVLDAAAKDVYPFRRPSSVRPRPDGTFWVVAFGSNEILRYDANFRLLATFRGGLAGLDRPWDVAEAPDGSLYVSEYGANRIAHMNAKGEKLATFGTKGRGDGGLLGPQYMALDRRGTLWVTDWGNGRVVRFGLDGTFLQAVGGIDGPTGILATDDRLYVAEKNAHQVLVFDLNGNRLAAVGAETLLAPEGLALAADGALLVSDGGRIMAGDLENETWTVRADASSYATRLAQEAVTPNGGMIAADFDQNRVVLLTDTTSLASGLAVRVERVNAAKFPDVSVEVSVTNRAGVPVVGLAPGNFIVTEGHGSVARPTLARTNSQVTNNDVTLLLERSPGLDAQKADVTAAVGALYGLVGGADRIKAVSAADRPVREADFGETRLRFVNQALQAPATARWRFDLGLRMAGDELIASTSGARRSIVFYSTGSLGQNPFSAYSVLELAAYLRVNDIGLFPVVFGGGPVDEDLAWLTTASGGALFRSSSPGGLPAVVRSLKARTTAVYTVRYTSRSPAEFGERYIPVEIEVTSQKVSGREESGYYAPAGYEPPGAAAAAKE